MKPHMAGTTQWEEQGQTDLCGVFHMNKGWECGIWDLAPFNHEQWWRNIQFYYPLYCDLKFNEWRKLGFDIGNYKKWGFNTMNIVKQWDLTINNGKTYGWTVNMVKHGWHRDLTVKQCQTLGFNHSNRDLALFIQWIIELGLSKKCISQKSMVA